MWSRLLKRDESDELNGTSQHLYNLKNVNKEIFNYIHNRQYGLSRGDPKKLVKEFVSQQMPGLFQEFEYHLERVNKIFCSQWLNDKQVVIGTKCNKLLVIDLVDCRVTPIPSLKSSDESLPAVCPCGIHSIKVNPSGTLLATGAEHTNDLAVYKLPTFDPVYVGECGHEDWIFDLEWIDDEFVVSGSRDNKIALWKVSNSDESFTSRMKHLHVPEYAIMKPEVVEDVQKAQKVRALSYNSNREELGVLTLNAHFHLWDAKVFKEIYYRRLPHNKENVCLAVSKEKSMYAIGSQSHINLIDPRSTNTLTTIISKYSGGGVRSVSFQKDIITIGTGVGQILFFDLKAGKYLECNCGHACSLEVGDGMLLHDENYHNYFFNQNSPNAVYTHHYDSTGTRLFAAGGPLPAGLWGNYAALWS
ncbi:hypothetical protein ScPMuIL_018836 [Solemya velum]